MAWQKCTFWLKIWWTYQSLAFPQEVLVLVSEKLVKILQLSVRMKNAVKCWKLTGTWRYGFSRVETVQPIFPDQYEFTLITIYSEFSVERPSFELTLFPGHSFANVQSVSGQVAGKGDSDNPCKQKENFRWKYLFLAQILGLKHKKNHRFVITLLYSSILAAIFVLHSSIFL